MIVVTGSVEMDAVNLVLAQISINAAMELVYFLTKAAMKILKPPVTKTLIVKATLKISSVVKKFVQVSPASLQRLSSSKIYYQRLNRLIIWVLIRLFYS